MIKFKFMNHSFGSIECEPEKLMLLWEAFSFYVPGYRFMKSFQRGTWDGKIRLINISKREFPVGLINNIKTWCDEIQEDYEIDDRLLQINNISEDDITNFINKYTFWSKGKEIVPRDDQLEAIFRAIINNRCINICPTSFGKSLCIFIQALWNIQFKRKILIVVPTVNLVKQFYDDIIDYCTDENGIHHNLPNMKMIYGGIDKDIPSDIDIVISTWQSIHTLDETWINQFDCIVLDEAHKGSAECIKKVFETATSVGIRTGWTGSLKESSIPALQVEALIGPIKIITDTATLMDKGIVANLSIKIIKFDYNEDVRIKINGIPYTEEIKFIENYKKRTETIAKMCGMLKNTGLLLYTKRAHGLEIYETVRKMHPTRNVYRIDGSAVIRNDLKYKTYEELKPIIENEKDAILICSFGVFSTGISIKNINYIMFTNPLKSFVRTIQSIGRALRISETKKKAVLFDIVDDFSTKPKRARKIKENYAIKQFKERFNMYMNQKFSYDILSVKI